MGCGGGASTEEFPPSLVVRAGYTCTFHCASGPMLFRSRVASRRVAAGFLRQIVISTPRARWLHAVSSLCQRPLLFWSRTTVRRVATGCVILVRQRGSQVPVERLSPVPPCVPPSPDWRHRSLKGGGARSDAFSFSSRAPPLRGRN